MSEGQGTPPPGDAGASAPGAPPGFTLPRLRIGRDGAWYDGDEEVTHPGIVANLWSNLRIDDEGHHLQVGPIRVPVEVDDVPFVVQRAERRGDALELTLIDGTREPLDPAGLRLGAGEVPYCRVKGGASRRASTAPRPTSSSSTSRARTPTARSWCSGRRATPSAGADA